PLAKAALTEAVTLSPQLVEAYLALAALEVEAQSFGPAITAGEKVLQLQPQNTLARLLLGQAYLGKGETSKAIAMLQAVTEQTPKNPLGYYHLGRAYRQQKQEREALKAFEQALVLNPDLQEARSQVVELYLAIGETAKAEKSHREALQHS